MLTMERKAAAHRLVVAQKDMTAAEAVEALLQAKYARLTRKIQSVQKVANQ